MKSIDQKFKITVLESSDEHPSYFSEMKKMAIEQLDRSYAPYSGFHVGAALVLEDGIICGGSNQENASYPLCMCAERTALYHMAALHNAPIVALAVTAKYKGELVKEPAAPCGACRQVILEYEERQNQAIKIYLIGADKSYCFESAKSLLPMSFGRDNLL